MSMRLIDAEYLLYGMAIFSERENGSEFMKGVDAVAEMIESAETISPAAWIPCAERLPSVGEEVDVTYQIDGKREAGCGRYIGNEQWIAKYGYGHDDEAGEVLAWKPCQEPYRG